MSLFLISFIFYIINYINNQPPKKEIILIQELYDYFEKQRNISLKIYELKSIITYINNTLLPSTPPITIETFLTEETDKSINCKNYNKQLSICEQCNQNYTLLNGECVCYDRNCKKCSSSFYGGCTECYSGYSLSLYNECQCKISHCLLCDDEKCNICEQGYSLTNNDAQCIFNYTMRNLGYCIDQNCDICLNKNNFSCIKCNDGYNLINGNCEKNPSLELYFDGNMICDKNYISGGNGCNKVCLGAECDKSNPELMNCDNSCVYCKHGILYDVNNCKPQNYCFDKNCIKCRTKEEGTCDKCDVGYKLYKGGCEKKCDDVNCLNCDYTLDGSCNWCKKGFLLIDGKCFEKRRGYSKNEIINYYKDLILDYVCNLSYNDSESEKNCSFLGNNENESFNNDEDYYQNKGEDINRNDINRENYYNEKNYKNHSINKNIFLNKTNKNNLSSKNHKNKNYYNKNTLNIYPNHINNLDIFSKNSKRRINNSTEYEKVNNSINDTIRNNNAKNKNNTQDTNPIDYDFLYHSLLYEINDLINVLYQQKFSTICNINNCFSCLINNSNYCIECENSFSLLKGKCIPCDISDCSICYSNNTCIRCKENYILINNKCVKNAGNIQFCLKYLTENQCLQCEDNYILNNNICMLDKIITQNLSYPVLSCSNDNLRQKTCIQKYYYTEEECKKCYDNNCNFCYDNVGCIICQEGTSLIDGRCLKSTEFNETVEDCISYDYDGKCLSCSSMCLLKENICDCSYLSNLLFKILIIAFIVIIIIAIILVTFQKTFFKICKKKITNNDDSSIIDDLKINTTEINYIQNLDDKLEICSYCKIETALFKLSCGCYLCKEDFNRIPISNKSANLSENNNNINIINNRSTNDINENLREKFDIRSSLEKNNTSNSNLDEHKGAVCPVCLEENITFSRVAYRCEICFDITSRVFHFNCDCSISVCKLCFNKIIETKRCPCCRKNLVTNNENKFKNKKSNDKIFKKKI